MRHIEGVGPHFDSEKYQQARRKTISVVKEVSSNVFLGMSEEEGAKLVEETLKKYGAEKKWHPTKFRIGKNTTKSFKEKSYPVSLQENDLYYIDIGPVFNGHEGDYGETFIFGKNKDYERIILASKEIFHKTAKAFKERNLTGRDLYQYAFSLSHQYGYELIPTMKGHRLGDFPHGLFYKGGLSECDFSPKENLWILEILIKHPKQQFGAFYEDLI